VLYEPSVPPASIERRNWLLLSSTVSLKDEFTDQSQANAGPDDMLRHNGTAKIARFTIDCLWSDYPCYSNSPRSGTIMTSPA
jgi:hypothetical protein